MAFQFQSVAALSPLIAETYAIGLADIGLLIGLYLMPGVVLAIPGGAIAARFGEKRIVTFSLVLMLVGGLPIWGAAGWGLLAAGRVLAGVGGVVISIVLTKMVVDWFAGREINTAMAVFVNSWPVGIALSLLGLPGLAAVGGLDLASALVVLMIAIGLVMFVLFYHAPPGSAGPSPTVSFARLPLPPLVLAGLIWALYNSALAMVFSFGPALLSQRGWSLAAAGSATSIFMIVLSISVPLGGILADRTGRRDMVICASLVSYAVLLPLVPFGPPWSMALIFVVVGLLFGLAAGPIMTLPSVVLPARVRTFGMGVFFSIYYGVMMGAPSLAGNLADRSGDIGLAFLIGSGMCVLCLMALAVFRRMTKAPVVAS